MKKKITAAAAAALSVITAAISFTMNAFAEGETASGDTASQGTGGGMTSLIVSMLLMLVLLYFMAIRPQKKREKEAADMQKGLQIGDEIVTTGGIVGMITRIGDDNVVIETGGERNKIRVKKWAVAENITANERIRTEKAKAAKNSPLAAAGVSDTETEKKKSKKSSDENK
ncbi:MAG: preprotein translocase subunit YajC [Ruminococcus sp.]|nr:preprotein translocase subunit YajC [Ruminococcus sp.]